MRVYQLAILTVQSGDPPSATVLVSASDLSQFSFYQRGSVGEFMTFMSKTVAERTQPSQRQSVQESTYTAHCYNRGGSGDLTGASNLVPYRTVSHRIGTRKLIHVVMCSRGNNRPRISRPCRLFCPQQDPRRVLHLNFTRLVLEPLVYLLPRARHISTTIPRPPAGGQHYARAAGAG